MKLKEEIEDDYDTKITRLPCVFSVSNSNQKFLEQIRELTLQMRQELFKKREIHDH